MSSRLEGDQALSNREDTMEDTIITTYYLCEQFLKTLGHRDDQQVRLSTAEVMCSALVAAAFFGANIEKARTFLDEYGYRQGVPPRDASTEGSMP
jgi:hypothetical protein